MGTHALTMRKLLVLSLFIFVVYAAKQPENHDKPVNIEKRAWNFNSRGYNRGYRKNQHQHFKRQLYDYLKMQKNYQPGRFRRFIKRGGGEIENPEVPFEMRLMEYAL